MDIKHTNVVLNRVINYSTIDSSLHYDLKDIFLQTKKVLEKNGVALVKGLKFDQLEFESFTQFFCSDFFRVTSREKFRQESGDGFTTLTPLENFTLLGHVEVEYVPGIKTPDVGFLFCQVAPKTQGGETFLINGISLFNALSEELQERFKNENIVYEFFWEPQRWQAQYNIQEEEELVKKLERMDNISYTLKSGWLHMFYTTSGIVKLQDGSIAFSNAILGHLPYVDHPNYKYKIIYSKSTNRVYWGDGELFSKETINELIDAHDKCKLLHVWENNDLLIFNNFRYLHGREETVEVSERILFSRFGYLNIR